MAKKLINEISYSIPIKEFGEVDNEFKIKGVAINETTTSNGHRFLAEELSEATSSLNGVPLLKDHINSVDNIIGRVKTAIFDEMNKNIRFEAVVNDKSVKEMIKDGRLNSVSVGADVRDLEEADDGALIVRGIEFKELSAVAIPADMGATFGVALMEAYKNHNSEKSEDNTQLKGGQITMSEEAEKTTETPEEAKEEPKAEAEVKAEPEAEPEKSEEAEVEAKLKALKLELKKKELAVLEKKLKESDADEKPKEEKEEKEEEEADEEEEVDEAYKVVSENGFGSTSFTVVRSKY